MVKNLLQRQDLLDFLKPRPQLPRNLGLTCPDYPKVILEILGDFRGCRDQLEFTRPRGCGLNDLRGQNRGQIRTQQPKLPYPVFEAEIGPFDPV